MTYEYVLEQFVIGPHLQIGISEERYNELSQARKVLSEALAFEQRYELLLGNFIALELALTEVGLRARIEWQYDYSKVADFLDTANRHVVNLLTALRGYADQVLQDFKCLPMEPSFGAVARAELNNMHARSADYRFMYELRNYVQHQATAVDGFQATDDRRSDANGWAETVRFTVNKGTLAADSGVKARVLDEQPEQIDVRRRARGAVEALGAAHIVLRRATDTHVKQARLLVEAAIDEYKKAGAESTLGLGVRRLGDDASKVSLLLDWDDVRRQLVEKNRAAPRLWPSRTHDEPKPTELVKLREEAGQTQAQAAKSVFVPEERWRDYEDGLPMPEGLFHLYRLQAKRHPTHRLERLPAEGGVGSAHQDN